MTAGDGREEAEVRKGVDPDGLVGAAGCDDGEGWMGSCEPGSFERGGC